MTPSSDLAGLRAALRLVQRDVDRYPGAESAIGPDGETGDAGDADPAGQRPSGSAEPAPPGRGRFQLVGTEQGIFVALPDGRCWLAGTGPLPLGADGADAVLAVAAGVQECFAEILWHAWPRCPAHGTTLRAEVRSAPEDVIWWCDGDERHDLGPVGRLGSAVGRAVESRSAAAPVATAAHAVPESDP